MSQNKNFLLGRGEMLTSTIIVPTGGGPKKPPYDFPTARDRVATRVHATASAIRGLSPDACPGDEAVAIVTLHPRYVSKSAFPLVLLREVGLRPIGSRPKEVRPDAWGLKNKDTETTAITAAIFVAGRRAAFDEWERTAPSWGHQRLGAGQLTEVEDLTPYLAVHKVRNLRVEGGQALLELVLHTGGMSNTLNDFETYAARCGATLALPRARRVDDLWFIPATCDVASVSRLADFTFLRVVRGMPVLRPLRPSLVRAIPSSRVDLPTEPALDASTRIAIFDGGLPKQALLPTWVRYHEPSGIGPSTPTFEEHGLHVTSAALFGSLEAGVAPARPPAGIDHYRVLDDASSRDPFNLVDVLDRILKVLDDSSQPHEFVNISLGPDLAVEDDEVTLWTSSLDARFANPSVLLTVAAGNGGNLDAAAGLNRVQPPADAVNALCVGAADSTTSKWSRAGYSCMGPGRSPGVLKPDGVAFGGSEAQPFKALDAQRAGGIVDIQGTSFASPTVLRAGAGLSVVLGKKLSPLAIRTLLIHRADRIKLHPFEVGWGRFITDIDELITCGDDEAHVVYQGSLPVGRHLRAQVPLPDGKLPDKVEVWATICIAPEVDAAHPFSYTRSGLEIIFRPHSEAYSENPDGSRSAHPTAGAFFAAGKMYTHASQLSLREGGKWEPVLSNRRKFPSEKLKDACFDIYYHHRVTGLPATRQDELPYALVISVRAKGENDLYNAIVRTYQQVLQPIQPVVRVPIRLSK